MKLFVTYIPISAKLIMPALIIAALLCSGCSEPRQKYGSYVIGSGKMPNIASDDAGNFYIVYGAGDSILYNSSADGGKTFSAPTLVGRLPHLVAFSMRGPQVASTKGGAVVIACNKEGDIFSFTKNKPGNWLPPVKVNDIDTVAKEGLMALSADGDHAFAVWLDLRHKHNEIAGAASDDGGKTWSENRIIYHSPDTTVCECCKPSVVVHGNNVTVMFRNHLNGSRDLYLISSADGGKVFGAAEKLGANSWKLNACPMDGGGLAINNNNLAVTVWRRHDSIFSCRAGEEEKAIAKGQHCSIESINGKNVYAWTDNGEVIVRKPAGQTVNLGKGQLPLLKRINNEHVLCTWEKDKQVLVQTISL
jgi:hypothetical protein